MAAPACAAPRLGFGSAGGPQQLAYPMDPQSKVVRDGSLLNQVILIRLDPVQLSAEAREYGADGVVA